MKNFIKKYMKYLRNNPQNYWFKGKLFGWGWTPVTWQGWFVTLVYVIFLVLLSLTIKENSNIKEVSFRFFLPALLLTIILALDHQTN